MFAALVFAENLACAVDYCRREACEAGDFDAIAFVGAAGFYPAQKNDFVSGFVDGDVDVADAGDSRSSSVSS